MTPRARRDVVTVFRGGLRVHRTELTAFQSPLLAFREYVRDSAGRFAPVYGAGEGDSALSAVTSGETPSAVVLSQPEPDVYEMTPGGDGQFGPTANVSVGTSTADDGINIEGEAGNIESVTDGTGTKYYIKDTLGNIIPDYEERHPDEGMPSWHVDMETALFHLAEQYYQPGIGLDG